MHLQSRIAGDIAGPSGGQGSSAHPEKPLIKEDNALATLQAAFPKEVKYKTIKGLHHSRSAQITPSAPLPMDSQANAATA